MRLFRPTTCAIVALGLLVSGEEALAAGKGWIEKLSGPGPFWGIEYPTMPLWCFPEKPKDEARAKDWKAPRMKGFLCDTYQELDRSAARPLLLTVTYSDLKSEDNPLAYPPGTPGSDTVRLRSAVFSLDVRLHPGLDVGVGLGVNRFSGDRFDTFHRVSVEPLRVVARPVGFLLPRKGIVRCGPVKLSLRDLLQVKFRTLLFTKGFEAEDFDAIGTFQEPSEFLWGYSFTLGLSVWW